MKPAGRGARGQLVLAGKHNPELLADYVKVEQKIGHKFRMNLSLVEVQEAVTAGAPIEEDDGNWNM